MLSKNDIKFIRSLGSGKFRKKHSLFIAEGRKVINEFLNSGWIAEKIFTINDSLIENNDSIVITHKELQMISQLTHPKDSLAVFQQPEFKSPSTKELKGKLSIVCETIQDPGNLGTIIRIADWFGVEHVVCSIDSVDVFNSKVVQASMGSLSRVKLSYVDLALWVKEKSNDLPILVATLTGENIYESNLPESCILVLGNEAKGVSDHLMAIASAEVNIPLRGGAESLNVAVSAGIICSEYSRRYPIILRR